MTPSSELRAQRALAGIPRRGPQFLLDPQQLVVLRDPVAAARGSSLDLTGGGADGEVVEVAADGFEGDGVAVAGGGGVSPANADAAFRLAEARYGEGWYRSMSQEIWDA